MKLAIAALSSVLATGCATQGVSNSSYMPTSTKPVITNEVAVNGQYSAVWDGLVRVNGGREPLLFGGEMAVLGQGVARCRFC